MLIPLRRFWCAVDLYRMAGVLKPWTKRMGVNWEHIVPRWSPQKRAEQDYKRWKWHTIKPDSCHMHGTKPTNLHFTTLFIMPWQLHVMHVMKVTSERRGNCTGRWTTLHSSGKLDTKYTVILFSWMSQSAATMTMGRNTFCQSFGFYFYCVVQSKYRFWQEAVRWKTFSNPPKRK